MKAIFRHYFVTQPGLHTERQCLINRWYHGSIKPQKDKLFQSDTKDDEFSENKTITIECSCFLTPTWVRVAQWHASLARNFNLQLRSTHLYAADPTWDPSGDCFQLTSIPGSDAFWLGESFCFHFSVMSQTFSSFVVDRQGASYTRACETLSFARWIKLRNYKKVVFKLRQGRLTTFFPSTLLHFRLLFIQAKTQSNFVFLSLYESCCWPLMTMHERKSLFRSSASRNLVIFSTRNSKLVTWGSFLFDMLELLGFICSSPRDFLEMSTIRWLHKNWILLIFNLVFLPLHQVAVKFNGTRTIDVRSSFLSLERVFLLLSFATPTNFLSTTSWPSFSISINVDSGFEEEDFVNRVNVLVAFTSCWESRQSQNEELKREVFTASKVIGKFHCANFLILSVPKENRVTLDMQKQMQNYLRNFTLLLEVSWRWTATT